MTFSLLSSVYDCYMWMHLIQVVVGDVSPHFKHFGYKSNPNIYQVVKSRSEDGAVATDRHMWLEKLENALKSVGLFVALSHKLQCCV